MTRRDGRRAATSVLVGLVAACSGPAEPTGPSYTITDSAGIEIVVNHRPAWARAEEWRVSRRAELQMGELDGPLEFTFGRVRAAGSLPDGRIFVGDEQAHTIRIFSPDGDYLESVGREGEGPGELQWFLLVDRYRGDSLYVYDYDQRAVSIFGPTLTFARRFPRPPIVGNYWVVDALSDGRFLLASAGETRPVREPGLVRDTSLIIVLSPDGASADTVGAYLGRLRRWGPDGREPVLHLAPSGTLIAARSRLLWTRGDVFQYTEADPDGTVRRIVRKVEESVPVTDDVIADFKAHFLEEVIGSDRENTQPRILRMLEEAEYHHTLPATSLDLKVDPLGNRWVGRYHFQGARTETWEIFDSTGVWLGTVQTPEGLEVREVGIDRIVGVAYDDFDVPYVRVHHLDRRGG